MVQRFRRSSICAPGFAAFAAFASCASEDADVAFEIKVGVQVLVDHVSLVRIFVHLHDRAGGGAAVRRIPGRPATDEQHQVGILEGAIAVEANVQRVVGRKVGVRGDAAVDHRDGERLGEFDQRGERLGIASGSLCDDDRVLCLQQQVSDMLHVLGRGPQLRSGRHVACVLRRRPVMQHVLERHVEVDRPERHALRHLAGAHHALIERVGAGHRACPFGDRFDEAFDAADRQPAIPLLLDVQIGILAERVRLARHHHHRHFVLHGAMNAHAPLQHANGGVQQDGLRAAGHQRVAARHVDGDGLVPGFYEGRPGGVVELLACQRLPDRRPFRARRRHDVVDLELAKRLQDGFPAVEIVFH